MSEKNILYSLIILLSVMSGLKGYDRNEQQLLVCNELCMNAWMVLDVVKAITISQKGKEEILEKVLMLLSQAYGEAEGLIHVRTLSEIGQLDPIYFNTNQALLGARNSLQDTFGDINSTKLYQTIEHLLDLMLEKLPYDTEL